MFERIGNGEGFPDPMALGLPVSGGRSSPVSGLLKKPGKVRGVVAREDLEGHLLPHDR